MVSTYQEKIYQNLHYEQRIIERLTNDLLKLSGSWESSAREIDEAIADVVDVNAPIEMIELSRELNNNGYDLILAGDNRDPANIESMRHKIREMTGDENPNHS